MDDGEYHHLSQEAEEEARIQCNCSRKSLPRRFSTPRHTMSTLMPQTACQNLLGFVLPTEMYYSNGKVANQMEPLE